MIIPRKVSKLAGILIMLAVIAKAFGLSTAPEDESFKSRHINLSGNIVHFAMPENFSRDMPAEDMIEQLNLDDQSIYSDHSKFTLIRRWWDLKEKGFLGKSLGTVMMSLYIKQANPELGLTTLAPLDLIDIIVDDIVRNNPDRSDPDMIWSDDFANYDEERFAGLRWIRGFQGRIENADTSTFFYAIPITSKHYLIAEFVAAPNSGISIAGFMRQYSQFFMEEIMNTFKINFVEGSPVKSVVTDQNAHGVRTLIEQKLQHLRQMEQKQ